VIDTFVLQGPVPGLFEKSNAMGYSSQSLENQLLKTWLGVSRSQALQLVAPKEPLWKISKWNQELGASILEDVSHVELALRNLLDAALGERPANLGLHGSWLDDPSGEIRNLGGAHLLEKIKSAKIQVARDKSQVSHEDVLAELTLGFWTALLGKRFLSLNLDLRGIFLGMNGRSIAALGDRLARIKALRNRVAHQHRILHRNLQDDFDLVILVAADIDHRLADFISDNSRTPEILIRITQAKSFSMPREPH
jgi:hypothetical protein